MRPRTLRWIATRRLTGRQATRCTTVLFLGTVAIKAAGPLTLGGRPPGERFLAVIALVAPALLAALVTYETLTAGTRGIEIDARLVAWPRRRSRPPSGSRCS